MMRDMVNFAYKAELFQMGTRGGPRKLLADCVDSQGASNVLAMTSISEEGSLIFNNEAKRRLFSFILKDTITHPYILSPAFVQLRDSKSVVIQPYFGMGSLRDLIYASPDWKKRKITPKSKHLDKYTIANGGKALDLPVIAKLGRQILEALFYLYVHGFPYPHLHTGNVLINEHGFAQLSDLENSLLCIDPKHIREIRKAHTVDIDIAPEVVSFGHVLFEMALGREKGDRSLKDVKAACPPQIYPILESILEPSNVDSAASLKSLLRLPFFQEVTLEVTVHQTVLTEKWDDRIRALLKIVRTSIVKICTPPVQPLARAKGDIRLSDGVSTSLSTPHASTSGVSKSRLNTSTSSSSSSSTLAKKPSTRTVAKPSTSSSPSSSSAPSPPPPPPAGAPSPPPPPPPSMAKMPPPQVGRDGLMAAIRAAGGLKAVGKD